MRERDFLRTYLDTEYHHSKAMIYLKQALCLQQFPNSTFFTLFDYTLSGCVDISVHSVESDSLPAQELRAYGAEWEDSIERAQRSSGRMELHVVRTVRGRAAPRYVLVPFRRARSDVVTLIKALVAEVPTALDDPMADEVWAKFKPRLDTAEQEFKVTH
ncbi:hypothetical protein C8R43DRAFT_1135781 [Mycena crocata]|nr:hypothetical protein C8R43DRAFT_1135781 [Mycena crocata]